MQQLPSAKGDRLRHFANLNLYRDTGIPAHKMLGMFWEIDEVIYDEFLNMLPPGYCAGGFRMIEKLTDDIAATFLQVSGRWWCGYTCRQTLEPARMLNHIARIHP